MRSFDFDAKRRQVLLGALGAAGAVGGMTLPWEALAAQAKDANGVLNIAYMVDVPGWDPTASTATQMQSIYETVFDSPLRYSRSQQLEARQIKSWEWQDQHAQRLAVTLRDDIVFHDGSKLTTQDLRWSLLERPSKNKKLAVGGMFQTLADVEIVSPTKAVLVYQKPTPAAPIYLAFLTAYILPQAYMEKAGDAFLTKPIGAGPYRLVDYQRNSRIVLEAFDKYWGGAAPIKRVTFEIQPEPAARVAAIESGRAGIAVQIPLREVKRLGAVPGIKTTVYPYSEIYLLRIPSYVKPFDDDNVRIAMHHAIDTQTLSKAFYGGFAPPVSVFATPGSPADVAGFKFPYDPKLAQSALARSGYGPNKPVKITLLATNGTFPSDYDMARAIVAMWQRVGIDAVIQETTPAKVASEVHAGKMTGALLQTFGNATGDPENYGGRLFDPRLGFSAWKDPALGPRIEGLLTEVDNDKRMAGYRELNREASEKSWAIPLLQAVTAVAYRDDVEFKTFGNGYILPAEYRLV